MINIIILKKKYFIILNILNIFLNISKKIKNFIFTILVFLFDIDLYIF